MIINDKVKIDCKYIDSEKTFHRTIKRILDLDDYYGDNLDALWDLLTEREYLDIRFTNSKYLEKNLGDYGNKIIDLFEDLSKESDNYRVSFY